MGNQAEQIEGTRQVEVSKHDAQSYERPPTEAVVASSGDTDMNENKQSPKSSDESAINGGNTSLPVDEIFEGDPNLFVPQYEDPDGEDEAKDFENVDGNRHSIL